MSSLPNENPYHRWVESLTKGITAILTKSVKSWNVYNPYGNWNDQFVVGSILEGMVRIHRKSDPGLLYVTLEGSVAGSDADWSTQEALSAVHTILPGEVWEAKERIGSVTFMYDHRPRVARLPCPLYLHWASELESVVSWLRNVPHPIKLPGTDYTRWTTRYQAPGEEVESELVVIRASRSVFQVSCKANTVAVDAQDALTAFCAVFNGATIKAEEVQAPTHFQPPSTFRDATSNWSALSAPVACRAF